MLCCNCEEEPEFVKINLNRIMSTTGLMRDLNVPLSAVQLSQAIAQLDPKQQGKVSFGEFLLWWKG